MLVDWLVFVTLWLLCTLVLVAGVRAVRRSALRDQVAQRHATYVTDADYRPLP